MKRTSKKLLSFFLAVVMVVTSCSVGFTAFAADGGSAGPAAVCGQHPLVRPADEAAGGGYADPVPGRRRAAEGRHGPGGPVRRRCGHGAAVRAGGLRVRAAAEL